MVCSQKNLPVIVYIAQLYQDIIRYYSAFFLYFTVISTSFLFIASPGRRLKAKKSARRHSPCKRRPFPV